MIDRRIPCEKFRLVPRRTLFNNQQLEICFPKQSIDARQIVSSECGPARERLLRSLFPPLTRGRGITGGRPVGALHDAQQATERRRDLGKGLMLLARRGEPKQAKISITIGLRPSFNLTFKPL